MVKKIIFVFIILFTIQGVCQNGGFIDQTDNYLIKVEDTDPVSFPPYFAYQSKIDSIIKQYDNAHQEALAIEKFQLKTSTVDVVIDSMARIVKLQNGNEIRLVPNPSNAEAGYTFEKDFEAFDYLLFRVQWYEGKNYFFINTKTGQKTYIIGRPFLSPNKKYVICINDDIEAGYSYNGFQLFKINPNETLNEIWRFSLNWGPEKIVWIGNDTFIVWGYYYDFLANWEKKIIYKKVTITAQ